MLGANASELCLFPQQCSDRSKKDAGHWMIFIGSQQRFAFASVFWCCWLCNRIHWLSGGFTSHST